MNGKDSPIGNAGFHDLADLADMKRGRPPKASAIGRALAAVVQVQEKLLLLPALPLGQSLERASSVFCRFRIVASSKLL